jgi:chaperonin GroES
MTTHLRPIYDRIVVRRLPRKDKTDGGLFIPDTAKEKPIEGYVVAVGPGAMLDSGVLKLSEVKAGQTVMFDRHRGVEVTIGGEEHLVIREGDVLGVVEDAKTPIAGSSR